MAIARRSMIGASGLRSIFESCSNWGRWGENDEVGTLNLITDAKRRQAGALVCKGHTYALSRRIDLGGEEGSGRALFHRMTVSSGIAPSAEDVLTMAVHGFSITHVDALGHTFLEGMAYNGRRQEAVVSARGLRSCSVMSASEGVFTRGILLDVPSAIRGTNLGDDFLVEPHHLELAEETAGVRVSSGDAVLLRTGPRSREAECGVGLGVAAVQWLHHRDVAVYGGDCIEKLPSGIPGLPMPLHQLGLVSMGLCILDAVDMEALSAACRREGRSDFLLVISPLKLSGGTGSAVNPLGIF